MSERVTRPRTLTTLGNQKEIKERINQLSVADIMTMLDFDNNLPEEIDCAARVKKELKDDVRNLSSISNESKYIILVDLFRKYKSGQQTDKLDEWENEFLLTNTIKKYRQLLCGEYVGLPQAPPQPIRRPTAEEWMERIYGLPFSVAEDLVQDGIYMDREERALGLDWHPPPPVLAPSTNSYNPPTKQPLSVQGIGYERSPATTSTHRRQAMNIPSTSTKKSRPTTNKRLSVRGIGIGPGRKGGRGFKARKRKTRHKTRRKSRHKTKRKTRRHQIN